MRSRLLSHIYLSAVRWNTAPRVYADNRTTLVHWQWSQLNIKTNGDVKITNIINARWGCLSHKNHGKILPPSPAKQWLFKVHYQLNIFQIPLCNVSSKCVNAILNCIKTKHRIPLWLVTIYFVSDTKPHHCI